MASHLLIYASIASKTPAACTDSTLKASLAAKSLSPIAVVVRSLTGRCPLCGRGVSRLTGRNQPRQPWEIPDHG